MKYQLCNLIVALCLLCFLVTLHFFIGAVMSIFQIIKTNKQDFSTFNLYYYPNSFIIPNKPRLSKLG